MIEVAGLSKTYGDFAAVRDLSFSVRPGEVLGLVGPNGAGKTTTLRCIAGIIPPTSGSVRIADHDLATDPLGAKRALAFFPDEPRLFDYLTVSQHLAFVARIYGVDNHEAVARPLLEEFEIADKAHELPGKLSRGMKQKLAIACGLLHSPKVLFLDEPLTGLDPLGIRRMKNSIAAPARARCTIEFFMRRIPSGSRPVSGSSRNSTFGECSSPQAIASFCFMPRDSFPGSSCALSAISNSSSSGRATASWLSTP